MTPSIYLPEHLHDGMMRYLEHGIPTGSFLRAVLENDLLATMRTADPLSFISLRALMIFLQEEAPPDAWGSPEKVQAWIDGHAERATP